MMTPSLNEPGLLFTVLLGGPVLLFLVVLGYTTTFYAQSVDGRKVPQGSFWLFPWIGETIHALSLPPQEFFNQKTKKLPTCLPEASSQDADVPCHCSQIPAVVLNGDINHIPYEGSKMGSLYGTTFSTHVMGTPTILSSDVELTKTVYQQTNKLFHLALPSTTHDIVGNESLFFMKSDIHRKVRNLIKGPFSVRELESFIPTIDKTCQNAMASWKSQKQVRVYHEAKKYVLNISWNYLINIDAQAYPYMDKMLANVPGATQIEKLASMYFTMQSGMMALPLRIPGLKFYKAMNARKQIQEVLKHIIADRRSGQVECKDFLQSMLLPMEDGSMLTDDQVMDNIFTLLGASDVTTSTCLVWMVKYIYENPKVYKDIKVELDEIKKSKPEGELLTYEDIKKMSITTWTMQETLRMINVVGWFFGRSSDKDVQIKDVAIPKNWIIGLTHMFHLDERYFPEPEKFNPYRFEKTPAPFTFTPFGQGCRTCPGKDLAKFEILAFFYHLITIYSWEPAEPNEAICWHPFPHPEHLHPVNLTPRHSGD